MVFCAMDQGWAVVDGQQRLTTLMLLLASLLNVLSKGLSCRDNQGVCVDQDTENQLEMNHKDVIKQIQGLLTYHGHWRLEPSFLDRPLYQHAMEQSILVDNFPTSKTASTLEADTALVESKQLLDHCIMQDWLNGSLNPRALLDQILKCQVMFVQVSPERLGSVFQQLQQQSLFAMADAFEQSTTLMTSKSILYCAHPGVDFTLQDMVRNLLLSPIAHESPAFQLQFYQKYWMPLEQVDLEQLFLRFIKEHRAPKSLLEIRMAQVQKSKQALVGSLLDFAKFYSIWYHRWTNQRQVDLAIVFFEELFVLAGLSFVE